MAISYNSLVSSKTRYVVTLLSGTSWTVPTGCLYVNATLIGGGAGGGYAGNAAFTPLTSGFGGQKITSNITTTPGASIAYAIGAGGAGATSGAYYSTAGGTTTFTGATSAAGGPRSNYYDVGAVGLTSTPNAGKSVSNGGQGAWTTYVAAQSGSAGKIELEYWV